MYGAVTLKRYNGCSCQEKTDFDGRFFFILLCHLSKVKPK